MGLLITIGGLHGTGKSSVAEIIAKEFRLRRVSAGQLFRGLAVEHHMSLEEFSRFAEGNEKIDRMLDDRLGAEARKGNAVIDGQLAAWMAEGHSDLSILLTAPLDVRVRRIAERDSVDFEKAKHETITREESERTRYLRYYNIDISDLSVYDIILNTDKYDLEGVGLVLVFAVRRLSTMKKR